MPLVHKSSTLSLRQRIIPRRESIANLQDQNQSQENPEPVQKWNIAQRLKRRRSAQVLGERANTNVPADAPPVPSLPANLQSKNSTAEELNVPPTADQEPTQNWPLSAEIRAQNAREESVEDLTSAGRRQNMPRPLTRDNSGGGLMVRLRQSHQQLRQSFMLHNHSNSQAEVSPQIVSSAASSARPVTSHGRLRSVRSLGHMLSSSSTSQNASASFEPPLPFHPPTEKSPTASPKRKQARPNTPPESGAEHEQTKKSFWSRMKSGFREKKARDLAAPPPVYNKAASVASVSAHSVHSKNSHSSQAELSQRVHSLEAQLREAKAQLSGLGTPGEASVVADPNEMEIHFEESNPTSVKPQVFVDHRSEADDELMDMIPVSPADQTDPMDFAIDASQIETDPLDDLPVDSPADAPPSKKLSTVIEVASQECTPAQQRTEPPIMGRLKPMALSLTGAESVPTLHAKRASRSASPPKRLSSLPVGDDVFGAGSSLSGSPERLGLRSRGRAPSMSISIPAPAASPERTQIPIPHTRKLPPQLYFLPSTTYSPEKSTADQSSSIADPIVSPPSRQLPNPAIAASARARALVAASALPSTLGQSVRRPVGPIMPIIPSLTNMPARPPPLRRPSSMPSVSASTRPAVNNLASLILQEDPREDEDSFRDGSNPPTGISGISNGDSDSENDSDDDDSAESGLPSGFRSRPMLSSAVASTPRSVLGVLSPSEGHLRSPPTTLNPRANMGERGADDEDEKPPLPEDTLRLYSSASGLVTFTFPRNTPAKKIKNAAAHRFRPRALSSPPTARPQPSGSDGTAQSPNDKAIFIIAPPSPAFSDKENAVAGANGQSGAMLHQSSQQSQRPVIVLTAADGEDPDPADGDNDEKTDSKRNPDCNSTVADLDDPFRNQRFPPSGGSGVAIPVITTTTTVSSLNGRLADDTGAASHTTGGNAAVQGRERDARTKTVVASQAIAGGGTARVGGDRNSQLIGAQRQPEEWVWPDDVF